MKFDALNPFTEHVIASYQRHSLEDAELITEKTHHAQSKWRKVPAQDRANYFRAVAALLRKKKKDLAALMTAEMGKPISQSEAEIEKCAKTCDFFTENGAGFLADELIKTDATKSYIAFEPMGIVLAIMPWNFPLWQVFRAAIPALIAGNGMVLKHASNVPGCAQAIEEIFIEAGFPKDIFRNLFATPDTALDLIKNPHIQAVSLTGSTQAGKKVAAQAGSVLKKCVLELGGSDPYLILDDLQLEETVRICALARLQNAGQSCIAAKRFIILEKFKNRFEDLLVNEFKSYLLGDPSLPDTVLGPMARKDLRDSAHHQVKESIKLGATCLMGGEIPKQKGYFYPPTILTNVKEGMPVYEEEVFGPVASIISAIDEQQAIEIANHTAYGLGVAVFSQNINHAEKIARSHLMAGNCFVNDLVRSDWRLPFGGIKESGYGRELSALGIREFVNIKTVYIK